MRIILLFMAWSDLARPKVSSLCLYFLILPAVFWNISGCQWFWRKIVYCWVSFPVYQISSFWVGGYMFSCFSVTLLTVGIITALLGAARQNYHKYLHHGTAIFTVSNQLSPSENDVLLIDSFSTFYKNNFFKTQLQFSVVMFNFCLFSNFGLWNYKMR